MSDMKRARRLFAKDQSSLIRNMNPGSQLCDTASQAQVTNPLTLITLFFNAGRSQGVHGSGFMEEEMESQRGL